MGARWFSRVDGQHRSGSRWVPGAAFGAGSVEMNQAQSSPPLRESAASGTELASESLTVQPAGARPRSWRALGGSDPDQRSERPRLTRRAEVPGAKKWGRDLGAAT